MMLSIKVKNGKTRFLNSLPLRYLIKSEEREELKESARVLLSFLSSDSPDGVMGHRLSPLKLRGRCKQFNEGTK